MNTQNDISVAVPAVSAPSGRLPDVLATLTTLRGALAADVEHMQHRLDAVHPQYRDCARNLLAYLALRRHDLRPLQAQLAQLGLSSLGRSEAHVMATLDAVIAAAQERLPDAAHDADAARDGFAAGEAGLRAHAEALFGPAPPGRMTRIMVTMPSTAADDPALVAELLRNGMNCMRINCAHDDAAAWARMIAHLRRAERAQQRSCQVMMDLGGPKLRTGALLPGAAVMKIKPRRDNFGQVLQPARVWLTCVETPVAPDAPAAMSLPLSAASFAALETGARIGLTDTRGAERHWQVVDAAEGGWWAEVERTTYVAPGLSLCISRTDGEVHCDEIPAQAVLPREGVLLLQAGDRLRLDAGEQPGQAARYDAQGALLEPARIGCTLPPVLAMVRAGEPVWFDDGRIGGVIEQVHAERVVVRITHTPPAGGKLRADKGINFPDSQLDVPALTRKDCEDLRFVAAHADMVGLSFVNRARDVLQLQQEIDRLGLGDPAIVLKIETQTGFAQLPELLLAAMRKPRCGVMIARGDLAVECGFGRLAEVQEELLWLCEAARVPVIWATQVLESLAKQGLRSRAEITDAAMGNRAECVMLNKGPHIVEAVATLEDILQRMQGHQSKKMPRLRALQLARMFPAD